MVRVRNAAVTVVYIDGLRYEPVLDEHTREAFYGEDVRDLEDQIDGLKTENQRLRERDSDAAQYVESVIAMRTGFTGEPPYVGWKGLGLALEERLDELEAENQQLRGWLRAIEPKLDGLICYASTPEEYPLNGVVRDIRAALAAEGGE